MPRSDELVDALLGIQKDAPRLGTGPRIAGITSGPGGRSWDAFGSAAAPAVQGDRIAFVTLGDGTVLVEDDQPEGALEPLADVIEEMVQPPYRAAAVRAEGDSWTVVAEKIQLVELPGIDGDAVDFSVVDGSRELQIDGAPAEGEAPALAAIAEGRGDIALHAERVDGDTFAVDVFPL